MSAEDTVMMDEDCPECGALLCFDGTCPRCRGTVEGEPPDVIHEEAQSGGWRWMRDALCRARELVLRGTGGER